MTLVGATVQLLGSRWTVDTYTSWSEQYVWLVQDGDVDGRENMICRPAAVIARCIQLQQKGST